MAEIWIIVAIPVAIIMLFMAFELFWTIVEAVHPFMYRRVPLSEIHDHVCDMFDRGLNRTRMIITCEQSGREVRLVKTYKRRHAGMAFHLVVPDLPPDEPELAVVCAAIEALDLKYEAIHSKHDHLITLDIDCLGAKDKAIAGTDITLSSIVRTSESSTFCIRARGLLTWVEMYVDGATRPSDIWAASAIHGQAKRQYDWGHYYSRNVSQTGGVSLGYAIGRRISAWVFAPRLKDRL